MRSYSCIPSFLKYSFIKASRWPSEENSSLIERFGPPGESNLVSITPAYPRKLSWDPGTVVKTIRCHKKVADSLGKILKNVLKEYGQQRITALGLDLYSSCYNDRNKRNGNSKSMHSWGIAIDYFDAKNRLNWHQDKALFAQPDYDKWWEIWEDEGWVSLGRVRDFDWMHVQAVRLKGM